MKGSRLYIGLGIGTLVGGSVLAYHILQRNRENHNSLNKSQNNDNVTQLANDVTQTSEKVESGVIEPQDLFRCLSNLQIDALSESDATMLNNSLKRFCGEDQVKIINLINQAAAFTRNMRVLRESMCLESLLHILHKATQPNSGIVEQLKLSTVYALVNLACDLENQKLMMSSVADFPLVMQDIEDSDLGVACLKTLSNLSLTSVCHQELTRLIPYLYTMVEEEEDGEVLRQVVTILLNMSDEPTSISGLLACKAPENMVELISGNTVFTQDNGLLEKWIRFLKNLFHEIKVSELHSEACLKVDIKAPKGESMIAKLHELRLQMKAKVFLLTLKCDKEELGTQAKAFYDYLQPAAY